MNSLWCERFVVVCEDCDRRFFVAATSDVELRLSLVLILVSKMSVEKCTPSPLVSEKKALGSTREWNHLSFDGTSSSRFT
jgi:hypothetical protein